MKRRVKEAIIVEGRYDKNALSQVVDALIIETSGFGIFNDAQKRSLLNAIAEKQGIIVFTDSDSAGFMIRNHIKGCVKSEFIKHAYIPDIYGKERRKSSPSKEGKLGVEGMPPQVLLDSLIRAGASFDDDCAKERKSEISKADMYICGLSGKADSAMHRSKLLQKLELPEKLSVDAMLDVLNALMSREDFYKLCEFVGLDI